MTFAAASPRVGVRARATARVTPGAAMRSIPAGSVVSASPYCASPTTLLGSLADRSREVADLTLVAGLLLDDAPYERDVLEGRLKYRSWHVSGPGRRLANAAAMEYVPLRASDVRSYLNANVDVALVRVTPPDAAGNVSLGPSASYTKDLLRAAGLRIAEIDPDLPRTLGADATFPFSELHLVVESATSMSTYGSPRPSERNAAVAARVAPLIESGTVLQLGIGGVPEAVAGMLEHTDVGDLTLVGMLTDSMVGLLEAGRVRDGIGAVTVVELLGRDRVFEHAHENPRVQMVSSTYAHDPAWLGGHDRLVSVCSALAVDLTGQVASEQVAGRTLAGIGGSVDFFEGAHLSGGGSRIVALPSVTATGESRVLSQLPSGTPVTLPRHSVDIVVTEHGVAHLTGLSVPERIRSMLSVAAPEHRDRLEAELVTRHPGETP